MRKLGRNHKLNTFNPFLRQQYYLTWRDMSRQDTILSKFNSKKLWTFPSKDQYLPAYSKLLCDAYQKQPNPHRVFPVEVRKRI